MDTGAAGGELACLVCGVGLGGMDDGTRAAHVNGCLSPRADRSPAAAATASRCECAVCGRDLSEYSESARLHHANRCCDSLSRPAAALAPAALAPAAPAAALAPPAAPSAPSSHCVVCGKDITKLKNQTEHMKRCAKRTGMPAARLLELTRQPAGAAERSEPHRPAPPARSQKEQRQQRLGGGKENSLGVHQAPAATAAAHMPAESEIVTFLREAGLTKYCPMFLREEIDLAGATLSKLQRSTAKLQHLWPLAARH